MLLIGLLLSGSSRTHCSGAAKSLLRCSNKRACYSVAAKKPDTLWQQNSMPLSCSEKYCFSVTAKNMVCCGSKATCCPMAGKKPAAQRLQKGTETLTRQVSNFYRPLLKQLPMRVLAGELRRGIRSNRSPPVHMGDPRHPGDFQKWPPGMTPLHSCVGHPRCMKSKVPPLHMGDPLNTWGIYRCGPWGQRPPTHSWVVPIEKTPAHMGDPLITWGIYSILSATCVLHCTRHAPHMPHPLCFPFCPMHAWILELLSRPQRHPKNFR